MPINDPNDNQGKKPMEGELNISINIENPPKAVKHQSLAHKEVIENKDIDIVDKMKEIQKLSKAKDEEDEN